MQIATFEIEEKLKNQYNYVVGLDEAGRGPLAGPVVASATILKSFDRINDDKNWNLVRDSKKLSEKQREKAYNFVIENFFVGVGVCNHETIDNMNILQASFLAMKKAFTDLKKQVKNLQETEKIMLLIDGNQYIPNLTIQQACIPQGDKKIKTIAASSIIAKVTRDKMMLEFAEKYPNYFFEKHKGYGTKIHLESLQKFGPCEIHRKSFAPVRNCLK